MYNVKDGLYKSNVKSAVPFTMLLTECDVKKVKGTHKNVNTG